MKPKTHAAFLAAEALVCIILYFAREALPGIFTAAMAFPFEQIGLGLRALSLSGAAGNALAVALYVTASLSPAAALLFIQKRRKLYPEDALLAVGSAALFPALYYMVNPDLLGAFLGGAGQGVGKSLLGGILYSILAGYIVLRALRQYAAADAGRLQKYLAALLGALNFLFVYLAFGEVFARLMDSLAALRGGNIGNEGMTSLSAGFLILHFCADALPYILDILVVFAALRLLRELQENRYSEAAAAAAEGLSRLCTRTLAATVLSGVGLNLFQLVFVRQLLTLNSVVQLPILSLAFVLTALLLARYIRENKRLKDDNDMFI